MDIRRIVLKDSINVYGRIFTGFDVGEESFVPNDQKSASKIIYHNGIFAVLLKIPLKHNNSTILIPSSFVTYCVPEKEKEKENEDENENSKDDTIQKVSSKRGRKPNPR